MSGKSSEAAAYAETSHELSDEKERSASASNSLDFKQQDDADAAKPGEVVDGEPVVYKTGFQLFIIMATVNLSTLIASLDLGIVATAIPKITQEFQGLELIGWYGGACFLLIGATSAMWGKMFKYLPVQWTYMSALALYLVGSIVAAAAPSGIALVVGRAIQGWGCAEPKLRPALIGMWIGVFMTSTILGPVLGGVFTSELTWRWCFWINLPVGGVAIVLQLLFLRIPKHIKRPEATWKEIVLNLDIPGSALLLASLVCFTLALQWGGLTRPWSDGSVIACLVMWIVLLIGYFVCQWVSGGYGGVPLFILKSRMTWSNCVYAWLANAANFQVLFFLPYYFQSVKGTTPIISGVYTLPFMSFYALGAMMSGGLLGKTRQIHPLLFVSGILTVVGAALLYAMDVNTSKAWYICAQIPFGFGIGLGNQVPVTVVQAFSDPEHVATSTGIIFTAQSIYENLLVQNLAANAPNVDTARVLAVGASQLQDYFSGDDLAAVISAYSVGIKGVFAFSIAGAAMTTLWTLTIPFEKLPNYDEKKDEDTKTAASAA
nr:dehydrocurvularin exporter [Quercus suber]